MTINESKNQNKYLCFLDLDGVTHPTAANGSYFRGENMYVLIDCLYGPEISIVISSSWRLDMPLSEIKYMLGPLERQVVGATPEIDDPFLHHPRHLEVERYLKQTHQEDALWFAIDDTQAFYKPDAPVVITNGRVGFTREDCTRLYKLIRSLG